MGSPAHSPARLRVAGLWLAGLLAVGSGLACATQAPAPPAAGTGSVWGHLKLVPREGVTPVKSGGSPYASRRMRDVAFVDYSKPGFAVVHLDAGPSPAGTVQHEIRARGIRTRLEPSHAAVGAGGVLVVLNASDATHVLSAPALGLVRPLAPGQQMEIAVRDPGEVALFLLDAPRSESMVFVSAGAFTLVSADGRFALSDLAPGSHTLHAWHPRFPPARASLQIEAGSVVELDFELGVSSRDDESAPAALP